MTAHNGETEQEIIQRILGGEKQLFHALIRPVERSIYFLLYGLLKNETEAEDAAQETAIKVYTNLHLFRGDAQFKTWVLSIARNEGLSRLRRQARRREESIDAEVEEADGDFTPAVLTSWREVPAEMLERKEVAALLRGAIEELPEIYRNVVLLRDVEELSVREAADVLDISEAAVKVRLHRARALLQRALAPKLGQLKPERKGLMGWFR